MSEDGHNEGPEVVIEAELRSPSIEAQIMRFDLRTPTDTVMQVDPRYQLDMCLTPRPLNTRACYVDHWGHRYERLGDIFMIPPGETMRFRGDTGLQASIRCQIDPQAINEITGRELDWSGRITRTLDISNARIRTLLFRLTEEVRHPGLAWERMLELMAGELAIELARFCEEVDESPVAGGLAGWRLRLIDERLADESSAPTLTDLARLCNVSVRQLTRGFRASRACSIGDYVERTRMEAAKRHLVSGESVKTIAFAMGFSSPSSFAYAFRRAVGTSPSNFRDRQLRALEAL